MELVDRILIFLKKKIDRALNKRKKKTVFRGRRSAVKKTKKTATTSRRTAQTASNRKTVKRTVSKKKVSSQSRVGSAKLSSKAPRKSIKAVSTKKINPVTKKAVPSKLSKKSEKPVRASSVRVVKKPKVSAVKPKSKITAVKVKSNPKTSVADLSKLSEIGEITHYFPRIGVSVLKMNSGVLKVKDCIEIRGSKTNLRQVVASMQIESVDVKTAKKGQLVGLKVDAEVHVGDKVYKG